MGKMHFHKLGSTRSARRAYGKYRTSKGLFSVHGSFSFHNPNLKSIYGKTVGSPPELVVERQQLTLRLKRMKVTLPTIKEP